MLLQTLEEIYDLLISEFEDGTADPPALLRKMCALYGLASVAYFGVNVQKSTAADPFLTVTYSSDWVTHYKKSNYVTLDPVIRSGFSAVLPTEWNGHDYRGAKFRRFFGEASEFGIGYNGLTIPVRGRSGDRALFTITGNGSPEKWRRDLKYLKRDFHMFAYLFHQMVTRRGNPEPPMVHLAPREVECLKWKATGKTDWETSMIMGISEKTVRFYVNLILSKLGAVNTTHAVTKAYSENILIGPP